MQNQLNNTIEFFQAGFCYHPEAMINTKASWKKAVFPAMVALINHHQMGYILFDTGYSERFFSATKKMPNALYKMITPVNITNTQTIKYQLNKSGISAESIKYIFISHFHADHIAGLKDFPKARFICSKLGYQDIIDKKGLGAVIKGYLKELLPADFAERVDFIEDLNSYDSAIELSNFKPIYKVSSDNQMLAVSLPGHAKGHYGLYLEHQEGKSLLIGDACWTHHAYTDNCRPNKLTGLIMDHVSSYHHTVDMLRDLNQSNNNIQIIPSHCQETLSQFVKHDKQ